MRVRLWQAAVPLVILPLLAFPQEPTGPQEPPPAEKQTPQEAPTKPRLDLYGDPLPEGAVARMGTVRLFSPDGFDHILYSPDGRLIASAEISAAAIHLWDAATGKRVALLEGHEGGLKDLAFSPDGKRLASADEFEATSTLRVWEVASRQVALQWKRENVVIEALAFSPSGKTLALATRIDRSRGESKHVVILHDAASGKRLLTMRGHEDQVSSVAYSPDGKTVASGSLDGTIRFWDLETGKELFRLQDHVAGAGAESKPQRTGLPIDTVLFSPSGDNLVSFRYWESVDPSIHIWDTKTRKEVRELPCDKEGVLCVAFSPDGKRIAAGDDDNLRFWDAASGQEAFKRPEFFAAGIAFSPDGKNLAVAYSDRILILDSSTGEKVLLEDAHHDSVWSTAFSPDGAMVASASTDGTVRLWDSRTGKHLKRFIVQEFGPTSVSFSPLGRYLVLYDHLEPLYVFEISSGKKVLHIKWIENESPTGWPGDWESAFAFSLDETTFASGRSNGLIRIWTLPDGEKVWEHPAHKGAVNLVTFLDSGEALRTWGEDGASHSWETATGKKIGEGTGRASEPIRLAVLSPDRKRVATADEGGEVHVRDRSTGESLFVAKAHRNRAISLTFSPDGKRIVSLGETPSYPYPPGRGYDPEKWEDVAHYRLWDIESSTELLTLRANTGGTWSGPGIDENGNVVTVERPNPEELASEVAFSPDGKTLLSGGRDKRVHHWEVISGRKIRTLVGHMDEVHSIAFSPDGTRALSASDDGTLLCWDLRPTGPEIAEVADKTNREGLWADLSGEDAAKAYEAEFHLALGGMETVAFLRDRLKPVRDEVPREVARLVADLDHDDFPVRVEASRRLLKHGAQAENALRKALEENPTPEVRIRGETIVRAVGPPFNRYPSKLLQAIRGIYVLEAIGSSEAESILEALAGGSPWSWQTREAKAALERLEERGAR